MSQNTVAIHPKAKIGKGNVFRYGVTIDENVIIGDNNYLGNYVSILGNTIIGDNNIIGSGSVFGTLSNHVLRSQKQKAPVISTHQIIRIGNGNLFSDGVTVHAPVVSTTNIGNYINIGTRVHVAHDDIVEDHVIINAHCAFGGYVQILRGANIGAGVNVHPRLVIGQYSMLGLGSVIIRHIMPGATVVGNPQRYLKPNLVGMQRNKLSQECINELSLCLTAKRMDLSILAIETQEILSHFFETKKGVYVRDVSMVPSLSIK